MKLQLTCVHYYIYVTSQFATTELSPGRLPEIRFPTFSIFVKFGKCSFLKIKGHFQKILRVGRSTLTFSFSLEAHFHFNWLYLNAFES